MQNEGGRAVAVGAALRWVGNPGTVAAVLVLAFNDHVGKRAWPGVVTGKLSDVAWMLVAPPVLALLLTPVLRLRGNRPAAVGIAGTAVTFALAKAGPAGADIASQVWSLTGVPSRTVADPTDLLALPALALAWLLWRASLRPWRGWQALALIAVPAATVAMVATTPAVDTSSLRTVNGQPVLRINSHTWAGQDGGLTWTPLDQDPGPADPGDPTSTVGAGRCVPAEPRICYRVRSLDAPVEASEDGRTTWQPVFTPPWAPSPSPSAPGSPSSGAPGSATAGTTGSAGGGAGYFPGELEVVTLSGGGYGVIVHLGHHDLVVRTADGRWATVALPKPPPRPDVDTGSRPFLLGLPVALAAGWATALAGLGARAAAAVPAARRRTFVIGLAIRQVLVLDWVVLAAWLCGEWSGVIVVGSGWAIAGLVSLCGLPLLRLLPKTGQGPRTSGGIVGVFVPGLAVLTGCAALVPYLWWSVFTSTEWSRISWLALYVAVVGSVLGAMAGWLQDRPTPSRH
ncbi:hypothetical protein ACGFX4_11830 [Kitasatospora sp. NPDC048365]|uniref:hypothetical protein n=1 Tax=Kitasatospora sp. NPDC048365 TaxID=3364050 RepID=UPI00371D4B8F